MTRIQAIEQLTRVLDSIQSGENDELSRITEARDQVLHRYQPIFSEAHLPNLSAEEFRSFLAFENNQHWEGIHRHAGRMTEDMDALRQALLILVDESRPLRDRLEELRPESGQPMVPGLARATLTPILLIAFPDKYGVFNTVVEGAMKKLEVWPDIDTSSSFADRYLAVNAVLLDVARELGVDLWTLDALWWGIQEIHTDKQTRQKAAQSVLDHEELARLRAVFLERTPGFQDFHESPGVYRHLERAYKDELCQEFRAQLLPLLEQGAEDLADASRIVEAVRALLESSLERAGHPQNLMTWRYFTFLRDLSDRQKLDFARSLRELVLGSDETPDRIARFNEGFVRLLTELDDSGPTAAMSRSFPSLFLMLHDPDSNIFVRTSLFDDLARRLTGRALFETRPMTADGYRRALEFAGRLRQVLSDWGWNPQDMIDVQGFMWVAGETSRKPGGSAWLFQANPAIYDLEGALRTGRRFATFSVNQHRDQIRPGDRIYFWVSGSDAGFVAIGTVIDPPEERIEFEWERDFHSPAETRFEKPHLAVRYQVDRILEERLSKVRLLNDPVLQDLKVLRAPQGTNYSLSDSEERALMRLVDDGEGPRYFKVAPGEGGEFWEECLEGDFICVGWDDVGDLRQYESVEGLRAAVGEHYGHHWNQHAATISRTANRLWDLRKLKPGDRIVANRGTSEVLGVGEVREAGYEWRPERDHFRHVVPVSWDTSVAGPIPDQGGPWRQTIFEISPELYSAIVSGTWQQEAPPFERLTSRLREAGLYVPVELVGNYLLALQTKGFVILTGISGTGKTQLATHVADSLSGEQADENDQLCVVAVRPDWTDNRGLLGWQNPITGRYVVTPALRLLLRASDELESATDEGRLPRPYFLVLDEMNIARVEYYFSDFLSCLESGRPLHLHDQAQVKVSGGHDVIVPPELRIPRNVFITGTVNVDETTYNFSPKVLDRAFTLELSQVDLRQLGQLESDPEDENAALYLSSLPAVLNPSRAERRGANSRDWLEFKRLLDGELAQVVITLNQLLAPENRHFGYRVANEIARFTNLAADQAGDDEETLWSALDLALMEKVLPKFHGTQQELEATLRQLLRFATAGSGGDHEGVVEEEWELVGGHLRPRSKEENQGNALPPRLPRMALKTYRMLRRLRIQGFTSFIE